MVPISVNLLSESSEQWTKDFIEDASPNVLGDMQRRLAMALSLDETETVLNLYDAIEDEDLAGGEVIDQNNRAMDWKAVLKLHSAVRNENWKPTVLVLNETQLSQLLLDDKFIEYDYLPSGGTDIEAGLVREIMGMRVYSSTLVPEGTAYAIDKNVAGIMLIRRDVTVEDWSDPRYDIFGLKASTRFGLGILRSDAVAKMTNIKTTL
jgi:hypothetical protein